MATKLLIQSPKGEQQEIALDHDEYILGRSASATIRLNDRRVSRRHARIFRKGSNFHIEDLDSINGILVDGMSFRGAKKLTANQVFDVGGFLVTLSDEANAEASVFSLVGRTAPYSSQEFVLPSGELRIGRVDGNAIVIPDASVSRYHTTINVSAQAVSIVDHGSSNGTMVNGARVTEKSLNPGDIVAFGNVEFEFRRRLETRWSINTLQSYLGRGRSGRFIACVAFTLSGSLLAATVAYLPSIARNSVGLEISPRELSYHWHIDDLVDQAEKAAQTEAWADAEETLKDVLEMDPLHARTHRLIEDIKNDRRYQGRVQRARTHYDKLSYRTAMTTALRVSPSSRYADEASELAERAREQLVESLATDAESACEQEDWIQCRELAIEAATLDPKSDETLRWVETAESALTELEHSFEPFEKAAIFSDPRDPAFAVAELHEAIASYQSGEIDEALAKVLDQHDASVVDRLRYMLLSIKRAEQAGQVAMAHSNPRGAIVHFGKALALDSELIAPDAPSALRSRLKAKISDTLYELGGSAHQRGRIQDAFELWRRAAALTPTAKKVQRALTELEQRNAALLKRIPKNERARCARIREILATTASNSPVRSQAKQIALASACGGNRSLDAIAGG